MTGSSTSPFPDGVNQSDAGDPARALFAASLRVSIRALVTPDLIAEHRRRPFGPHGRELAAVLTYFRSAAVAGKLALLAEGAMGPYRIVRLSGLRGVVPDRVSDEIFDMLEDAEHAVFLRRVDALMAEVET